MEREPLSFLLAKFLFLIPWVCGGKCWHGDFLVHIIFSILLITTRIEPLTHPPSLPGPVRKPEDPTGVRAGCAAGAAGDRAAGTGSGEQPATSSLPEGAAQVRRLLDAAVLSHTGVVSALPIPSLIPLSLSNMLAPSARTQVCATAACRCT